MKKVPQGALRMDAFYLRPLCKVSDASDSVWYTSVPIGKNFLQNMLPSICKEVGVPRRTIAGSSSYSSFKFKLKSVFM